MNLEQFEKEVRQEIPIHATENPDVSSAAVIEARREAEWLDATKIVLQKRKRAKALDELYSRLSKADVSEPREDTPRCFSELCVTATNSLRNRTR